MALKSPSEFYLTLLDRCRLAKNRIVIASLYLGIGKLEEDLVSRNLPGKSLWYDKIKLVSGKHSKELNGKKSVVERQDFVRR